MKLEKYKLLEETDDHYRLDDGTGPFRVAKKGISQGMHERIAQHFALGGPVLDYARDASMGTLPLNFGNTAAATPEPAAPMTPAAPPEMSYWQKWMAEQAIANQLDTERIKTENAAGGQGLGNLGHALQGLIPAPRPEGEALRRQKEEFAKRGLGPAPAPVPAPAVAAPAQAAPPPLPTDVQVMEPRLPLPAPAPIALGTGAPGITMPGAPPGFDAASRQIQEGTQAEGVAAQQQAKQQAQALEEQEKARAAFEAEHSRRMAAHQAETAKLQSDIATSKIDPNHLWATRSTAQKAGGIIGIILSGIGQGLAGGPNMALQVLDKAIDQDLDAQKMNLDTKKGLLAQYIAQGREMGDAHQLAKATMQEAFAAQLQKAAAQSAGPMIQAQTQKLAGELGQKSLQMKSQLELASMDREIKMAELAAKGATIKPEDIQKQAEEYGKEAQGMVGARKDIALLAAESKKSDTPGVGVWDRNKPGWLQGVADIKVRQAVNRLLVAHAKMMGGPITPNDIAQAATSYGLDGTEAQYRQGISALSREMEDQHAIARAKYHPAAIATFESRLSQQPSEKRAPYSAKLEQ